MLFSHCAIVTPTGVLEDAYLAVEGDAIAYIGAEKPPFTGEERDFTGKLLLPGLVNAHTHAAMTLLRGVGSDLALHDWLFNSVFPVEDRLTAEDIRVGSQLALLELLAGGVTSFTDMYFFPDETAQVVAESGIKANLNRPVQAFDPRETPAESTRLREALAFYDRWHGAENGRLRVDFCVHAEYTCNEAVTRAVAEETLLRQGNLHIHLSETRDEQEACVAKYGKTPARWFYDLGAFDSHAYCAHGVWLTPEDMDLLAAKGAGVVHNPTSNMKLGSGFAPVPTLLSRGIPVALGTDGAASNNNLNLWEELHLAAILHNGHTGDPTLMKPAAVLAMATEQGALLQQRPDTGRLEVGKKADLCAIDLTAPHLRPRLDTLALLAYAAQASDVCLTMVDGRILYENGNYLTLDKERILYETDRCVRKLYRL